MKKSMKSLLLSVLAVGMLAGCDNSTSKADTSNPLSNSEPEVSSFISSEPSVSKDVSSNSPSSSSNSSSVVKTDIILSATKTNADLNERVLISANIQGVTFSTTAGATVENGVFVGTKEGTYVVTGHKDGDYNDGTIIIRVTFQRTATKVKNILKSLKTGENYTLNFKNLLGDNKLYRTQSYAFYQQQGEGQAILSDNTAHFIKLNNNKLVIGSQVVYTDTSSGAKEVATNLEEIDAFYDVDVDKLNIQEADGKFYCADREIKYSVARMLDSISVMFGDELEFDFDDNYNFTIRIMFYDPDTHEIVEEGVNNYGYLTFTNIGTTTAPVVDDALKNVTISDTAMPDTVASSFMSTEGHLRTSIKFVAGNKYADLGSSEYHFNEKYLKEDVDSNSEVIHNFYEKIGDDAYQVGINYDNTVTKIDSMYWSDFTFPYATFDISDFKKTGTNTYSYLGDNCGDLANDLAWASIGEEKIAYMTATESNGKITSIYCETRNKLYDIGTTNKAEYVYGKYVYEIEVVPYTALVAPAPFEADSNTSKIAGYFNEFSKENANYTLMLTDGAATGSYKKVKVTADTILIEQYLNSTQVTSYRGYHRLPDGVIQFSIVGSGDNARLKLDKDIDLDGQPLASLLGFKLAPEVLKFQGTSTLVFKDGVLGGGAGLFNELKYYNYAMDNTVEFTISNNHIFKIDYFWYQADNAYEEVAISDYGTTAFTSAFETKLIADLANIRTAGVVSSWQEEDETTYNALLTLLGSENVGLIPYVYNSEYTGNYIGALATSGTMVSIRLPSGMSYSTEFKAAFIAAAVVNGFTDESSGTTYKATKMIGEKRILIQFVGQNSLGITYKVPSA